MLGLFIVFALLFAALLLGCFGKDSTALALLRMGDHILEPAATNDAPQGRKEIPRKAKGGARPYLSPFVKKQVAARQKWRCAVCKNILDESYEIDHIRPLHLARNDEETKKLNEPDNLQALCRRDHMAKTAMQAQA